MTRVIAFGAFDPLNEAHKDFLRQAKALGDYLIVVVAHDSAIYAYKKRDPIQTEEVRVAAVRDVPGVDEVILGRKTADRYHLLGEIDFDIVALGYDQQPSDEEVREHLNAKGKHQVRIIRLQPYQIEKYPTV
jgi:FAD synthetase